MHLSFGMYNPLSTQVRNYELKTKEEKFETIFLLSLLCQRFGVPCMIWFCFIFRCLRCCCEDNIISNPILQNQKWNWIERKENTNSEHTSFHSGEIKPSIGVPFKSSSQPLFPFITYNELLIYDTIIFFLWPVDDWRQKLLWWHYKHLKNNRQKSYNNTDWEHLLSTPTESSGWMDGNMCGLLKLRTIRNNEKVNAGYHVNRWLISCSAAAAAHG